MNFKKYLPAIVSGFGAAVLSTIPGIKNFSCCLLVPGAAAFSILLDQKISKSNERILLNKSLGFGFLTGLTATIFITIFEILITYITRSNDFVQTLPQSEIIMRQWNLGPLFDDSLEMLKNAANDIEKTGFSSIYLFMILSSYFIINTIFGLIGGVFGMGLANRKFREE
ncbi:MAG TPA: hypothetical protein PK195_12030 [Ignavibacteriaceae bacterium]|nr:hypothetical protein [Ignavibacteriaceae bacterium]